jgi:hypothetical protein
LAPFRETPLLAASAMPDVSHQILRTEERMKNVALLSRFPVFRSASAAAMTLVAMLAAGCDGTDGEPDLTPGATMSPDPSMPADPAGPRPVVRIVEPADGATLAAGEVRILLETENIEIVPAGDVTPNSGHHHLLLNVATPPDGEPIPADVEGFVHLGQAQTEYTFENLAPGDYQVVAVIGDFAHRVIPQDTDTVRFTVRPAAP